MSYFVLWFVITVSPGHLVHWPVDGEFETMALCEEASKPFLIMLKEQWPEDQAVRVYCKKFIPGEET